MSTFETLIDIFKNILPDSDVDLEKVTLSTNIEEDLGINSIGMMYLVLAIEQEFDVELHNTSIESFKTMADVVNFIEENK